MNRKQSSKGWIQYVSDPKYFNPNDWKNLEEREKYLSTDFRHLLDRFRREMLNFQDDHYGLHDQIGVGLATPTCESRIIYTLCNKIISSLNADYRMRRKNMPGIRFDRWRKQNRDEF